MRFLRVEPGYVRLRRRLWSDRGDAPGRFCRPLGLPFGHAPVESAEFDDRWIEQPRTYWITARAREMFDVPGIRAYVRGHEAERLRVWGILATSEHRSGTFRASTSDEVHFAVLTGALPVGEYDRADGLLIGTKYSDIDDLWLRAAGSVRSAPPVRLTWLPDPAE